MYPLHVPLRIGCLAALFLAVTAMSLPAQENTRPRLQGAGVCSGVSGSYLALISGGTATVLSGAPFPGGRASNLRDDALSGHQAALWTMTISELPVEVGGCVAFDKDRFTWASDLATYVAYLVRDLLLPAQQLDPSYRILAIGQRTIQLEVARPGADTALLGGPEGAMLGYGRLADPERFFFLPVIVGHEEALLVRIFRNRGEPFGERATEAIGRALVRRGAVTSTDTVPAFELRWLTASR